MNVGFLAYSAASRGEFAALARFLEERGHRAFFIVPHDVDVSALGVRAARFRAERIGAGVVRNAVRLWRLRNGIDALIEREAPDVVVVNRDRGNASIACTLYACARRATPVVAMDPGITSVPFKARTHGGKAYDARRGLNRVVARLWPEQRRVVDGRDMLFHTAGKTAALAALSMLPPRPWANGENGAHLHLMISRGSVAAARAEGARADNAVVVGLPSLDTLYEAQRNRQRAVIAAELRAQQFAHVASVDSAPRQLCILAMPQLSEQKLLPLADVLREIGVILDAIDSTGKLLVIGSLHPSMERARYVALEQGRPLFRIATAPLSRIMSAADISIHAFPTTTLWSLLVGAPALYLDWWRQGYRLDDQPGVVVNRDRARLGDDLAGMLVDARAAELRAAIDASRAREELPPFDGRCRERALEALQRAYDFGRRRASL